MDMLRLIENGFKDLSYEDSTKNKALRNIESWLTDESLSNYVPYIYHLAEKGDFTTLVDSFWRVMPFGTGGRRGAVGAGPNRINPHTIALSVQGHADYLHKTVKVQDGDEARVVVAYDVRVFLDQKGVYGGITGVLTGLTSRGLARLAAEIYAANGIVCYVVGALQDEPGEAMCTERYISTPELSFLIRALKASGGLNISASHNHPDDNGAKVYNGNGGQEPPPRDEALLDMVETVHNVRNMPYAKARAKGLIRFVPRSLHEEYIQINIGCCPTDSRSAKVAYSPLCGTGINTVQEAFEKTGFNLSLVADQAAFDGSFSTVRYRLPNPEIPESMDKLAETAKATGCDIGMATDPDADRLGVVVPDPDGRFVPVLGNDIGVLLIESLCSFKKKRGQNTRPAIFITTQVTTSLQSKIAARYGCQVIGDLMTGFKYMAEVLASLEQVGKFPREDGPTDKDAVAGTIDDFIFACEESHGYLLSHEIRDKDACGAAVHLAGLASQLKDENRTIYGMLRDIQRVYGYHANQTRFLVMEGIEGLRRMGQILDRLRSDPPANIGGIKVHRVVDHRKIGGPIRSRTDAVGRNVLVFYLENSLAEEPIRLAVRPSGTEPKVKIYVEVPSAPCSHKCLSDVTGEELAKISDGELDRVKNATDAVARRIGDSFITLCLGKRILNHTYPSIPPEALLVSDMVPVDVKIELFNEMLPYLLNKISHMESDAVLRSWIDERLQALGDDPGRLLQGAIGVWMKRRLEEHPSEADVLRKAKALFDPL